MARRAQTIQADLRDARLRLAADDLVTRRGEFDDTNQAETALRREHDEMTARLEAATVELDAHESAVAGLSERAEAAQQSWFRLSALAERVSATVRIASERAQHLDTEQEASSGADPEALEAEADEVAAHERAAARRAGRVPRAADRGPRRADRTRARRRRGRTRTPGGGARRSRPPRRAGPAGRPGRHHAHPRRVHRRDRRAADREHRRGGHPRAAGQGRVRDGAGPRRRARRGRGRARRAPRPDA